MANYCHCARKTVHGQYLLHSDFLWVLDHYELTDTYYLCMLCLQHGCDPATECDLDETEADDE